MFLLAASDAPDRRDASEPASPDPGSSDSEPTDPAPSPGKDRPAPEPDIPPREPAPLPPVEPEIDPPDTPETPDTPEVAPSSAPVPTPVTTEASPPDEPDGTPTTPDASAPAGVRPPAPPARPVSEVPSPAERPARSLLQRVVLALLVIAAAALIGYVLSRPSGREADADALARSLEAAGRLQLRLETDTPAEARRYVRDEFGWRVGVPVFEAIPLRGVAIARTAPAVEVPVFLYADEEDRNVAVFAYSYALLDQVPDRLRLTDADYDRLDEGTPFVRRAGGNEVLLWRDRDDIYVAVTDLPPDALTDGLAMAR